MPLSNLANRVRRRWKGGLPTLYHPDYRLPISSLAPRTAMEPRRADLALWYLRAAGALGRDDVRTPQRAGWSELALAHPYGLLERLTNPEELARIFSVEAWDLPVEQVLNTVRLACGGTIEAARLALRRRGPALNLLGGFHHAGKERAGGFCPVNDVAVAAAALRQEGFAGDVAVLDLDGHPPDGIADCLAGQAWIGSLSGADWGPLPGVDETVLPPDATAAQYLAALDALLARMPRAELTFVIAGGDVRAGDPLATLALPEDALQERDDRVRRALAGRAAVWLPGGGYGPGSWRPLAGTGLVLALGRPTPIPADLDPLQRRFAELARGLPDEQLEGEAWLTEGDLADVLGLSPPREPRLLGFYTPQGVELALVCYGVLPQIQRLGYRKLHTVIDKTGTGDRLRLFGEAGGQEHLLVESVLERRRLDGAPDAGEVLFVHWMTLRHPKGSFAQNKPPLPGQEVPGLGMALEAGALLGRIAERLHLAGVALRPAWYHVAYASRYAFAFLDPARQGRWLALQRDLARLPLLQATLAVAEGRVLLNDEPYTWEADEMVRWLPGRAGKREDPAAAALTAEVAAASRFTAREAQPQS